LTISVRVVGGVGMPVPLMVADPLAFPLILSVAVSASSTEGVKTSSTVQEFPAKIEPPFVQVPVPVLEKSAAFIPVMVKYGVFSVSVALPVFETVTVKGGLL
jgi:hypothetical protein